MMMIMIIIMTMIITVIIIIIITSYLTMPRRLDLQRKYLVLAV